MSSAATVRKRKRQSAGAVVECREAVLVRIPKRTLVALGEIASCNGRSRNGEIVTVLRRYIEAQSRLGHLGS